MARKKTMASKAMGRARKVIRGRKPVGRQSAAGQIRKTWTNTLEAITTAENDVEKRVKSLLKRNRISTKDASAMFKDVYALIGRERKKALNQLEGRLQTLQARAAKQRKVVGRAVDEALKGAFASLNIPTRREVHELTRKVDELSRKIDRFKR